MCSPLVRSAAGRTCVHLCVYALSVGRIGVLSRCAVVRDLPSGLGRTVWRGDSPCRRPVYQPEQQQQPPARLPTRSNALRMHSPSCQWPLIGPLIEPPRRAPTLPACGVRRALEEGSALVHCASGLPSLALHTLMRSRTAPVKVTRGRVPAMHRGRVCRTCDGLYEWVRAKHGAAVENPWTHRRDPDVPGFQMCPGGDVLVTVGMS